MSDIYVSSGVTSTGVFLSGTWQEYANMYVLSAGTANGTTVDGWYASMFISSGGVVNNTSVNDHSYMTISSGGVANSTTIESGYMYIEDCGVADKVSIEANGRLCIYSGGTATNVDWTPCIGEIAVADGAAVTFTSSYSGVYFGEHEQLLSHANSMTGKVVSGSYNSSSYMYDTCNMYVMKGGEANNTTINNHGYMYVSRDGVANTTTIDSYGCMTITSGGTANNTFVNDHSYMTISSCGVANSTTINSGNMCIFSGGAADKVSIEANGWLCINSGGTATNVDWTPCIGEIAVADGATVTFTSSYSGVYFGSANQLLSHANSMTGKVVSGSYNSSSYIYDACNMYVMKGGVVNNTTIDDYGYMYVSRDGVANTTTIDSYGCMTITNGGTANSTTVNSGGTVYIESKGVANSTTIGGGDYNAAVYVSSGGVADKVSIEANGWLCINSGGTATNVDWTPCVGQVKVKGEATVTFVSSYSGVYFGENEQLLSHANSMTGKVVSTSYDSACYTCSMYVMENGVVDSTIVGFRGSMIISSGGAANNTSVGSYAEVEIYSGGTAKNTTVDFGRVYIYSGGVHSGSLQLTNNEDVSVYAGAILDFTVAEQEDASVALINDWSLIYDGNNADYTLTVETNQASGIYALAGGASGFTNSVTVKTTENTVLGTLSVGETKTFGETDYTLALSGGNLSLTITGEEPISKPAKSDVDGNNISDIVFQYTGGNYQIGFWMNGTNTWQGQGIGQPQDWELIGAYDMDQDGKADIVMRGNIQIGSDKGAYIGYYVDGDVNNWQNISYLNNPNDIDWRLAIGNITGNEGCNSLVWYSPELGALGVWTDGTDNWVSLGSGYDYSWTLDGCGDFNGDGKDDILFSHDGNLYCTDIDNNFRNLGGWGTDWKVCTTGDFSGDGKDDIILQNGNMVVKFEDGLAENWESVGVMDATDWFIVGAGDYNGDQEEDLLVRQYSTGMLGYYESGDMDKWVEVGRGVDMNWTVIA